MNQADFITLVTEEAAKVNPAWIVSPGGLADDKTLSVDVKPLGTDGPTRGIAFSAVAVEQALSGEPQYAIAMTLRRLEQNIREGKWPLPAVADAVEASA